MTAAEQTQHECQMRPVGGGNVCDRCALAFDTGDTTPACLALTFGRMLKAALAEADRIEASAHAAVQAGFRKHRDQAALKAALELKGCARLVDRCLNDPEILNRLARTASKPTQKQKA